MDIRNLIDNYITNYLILERYINDGSPSGFSIVTTKNDTAPKCEAKEFKLKLITIKNLVDSFIFGENIINVPSNAIFVHPDMLEHEILKKIDYEVLDEIIVAPTASGRTVLHIEQQIYLKLAYADYLGRTIRHLGCDKIKSTIDVTNQLIKVTNNKKCNSAFSFLREYNGKVIRLKSEKSLLEKYGITNDTEFYDFGIVYREFSPYPYLDDEYMIPFFSLFSKEYNPQTKDYNENHVPIIIQLYLNQELDLNSFILQKVLYPLYNTYFDALILGGIELEAHAQNLLITIDSNLKIKRIVCRDLESAGRDMELINYFNIQYIPNETNYKYNVRKPIEDQKYDKYTIMHSFMFDFKLGEYTVTPLLNKIKEYYDNFDILFIQEEIRKFNRKFIDLLPKDFFPKDWCTYQPINFNKTGTKRVYEWHENPKYR